MKLKVAKVSRAKLKHFHELEGFEETENPDVSWQKWPRSVALSSGYMDVPLTDFQRKKVT